jgi:hypothetical protein
MSLPIIAIEGETTSHEDFKELIEKLELSGEILPKQMKFSGRPVEWGIGWYQVDPSLPEVNTLISQRGYPSIIAGSHFISIREFGSIGRYGEFEAHANIPHQAVTQLMGDKTHLFFIEEGDFIFDDGRSYRRAIKCENVRPSSRNGMLDFELFGGYFFQKGDEKNRNFEVNIFPRRFVQKYERYGSNSEEQVLVRVQIRR